MVYSKLLPSASLLAVAATSLFNVAHAVEFFAPDWIIPANIGSPYPPMTVNAGDTLTFAWSQGTHDVWIYPSGSCNEAGKIQIGSTLDNPTTYTFTETDAGSVVTFVCDVGSHCEAGMLMDVTVLASETTSVVEEVDATDSVTSDSDADDTEDEITLGQYSTCYVCGSADAEVTNPSIIVSLPNPGGPTFDVSCADLYQDGLDGIIPDESCNFISQYAFNPCGCAAPNFACNICGPEDDWTVLVPNQQLTLPADPTDPTATISTTCGEFYSAGLNGDLDPMQCQAAPVFAAITCQCIPPDYSCNICGEGFKLNRPDDEILLPSLESGTCADLASQGTSGSMTPTDCIAATDYTRSTGTCGCVPEDGYPECLICEGEDDSPLTPDFRITLSIDDANSCGDLYQAGLAGEISPSRCLAVQAQSIGCNCAPADYTCDVCGGDGTEMTMLSPEANFTIPTMPGNALVVNCGEVLTAGNDGNLTPNDCAIVSPLAQAQCGCMPSGFTCNICGDDGDQAVSLPSSTFVPQNDVTCGDAEAAGLAGTITPTTCSFYQTQAARFCGCADKKSEDETEPDPTADPTVSPVVPPTEAPVATTEAPVATPVVAPSDAPVAAPVEAPVAAPVAAPVEAPVAAPVEAPVEAPVAAPVEAPVEAPVAAPVEAPVAAPVEAPVEAPVAAPEAAPVTAPVAAPVAAPEAAPVEAPVAAPVDAPVTAPVTVPVVAPTPSVIDEMTSSSIQEAASDASSAFGAMLPAVLGTVVAFLI